MDQDGSIALMIKWLQLEAVDFWLEISRSLCTRKCVFLANGNPSPQYSPCKGGFGGGGGGGAKGAIAPPLFLL